MQQVGPIEREKKRKLIESKLENHFSIDRHITVRCSNSSNWEFGRSWWLQNRNGPQWHCPQIVLPLSSSRSAPPCDRLWLTKRLDAVKRQIEKCFENAAATTGLNRTTKKYRWSAAKHNWLWKFNTCRSVVSAQTAFSVRVEEISKERRRELH